MLDQLWTIWQANASSPRKLDLELALWVSQHCLDADDFAFSLACAMQRHLRATAG